MSVDVETSHCWIFIVENSETIMICNMTTNFKVMGSTKWQTRDLKVKNEDLKMKLIVNNVFPVITK